LIQVAIDRAATLRNAEKLLRQGKLEQAIAEYRRIVDDQPRDWNTANILGDLYVRIGQPDKAVDQLVRIADHLNNEGFLPKAAALYKKILKLKPDHEHALMHAGEIAGSQGLLVDARSYFNALIERRRARGDQRGVAQMMLRLASLDPNDYEARLAAARARVGLNDAQSALSDFKEIAAELLEKGRGEEALQALREAAALSPDDEDVRGRLLDAHFAAGDYASARECATSATELKALAERLDAAGQIEEALSALREAASRDPDDADLKARLARTFAGRGDMATAALYLTVESAGGDPRLLLTVAEMQLRGGKIDEGMAVLQRLVAEDPNRRQDVAFLGWMIAEQAPDVGYDVVQLAADVAVAQADFPSAAAALQEYVTRVPNHIPALMRLVEICVDGGLEATMYSAQAHLADAYITAGSATEARFIAEDLVAREPWDRSNIERFRRALVLMGEPDPDGLIADRLSGHSPFMSTDVTLSGGEFGAYEEQADVEPPHPDTTPTPPPAPPPEKGPSQFELSANAIDLQSIFGGIDLSPTAHARSESVEVDLSIVLQDIETAPPASGPPAAPAPGTDLDSVFAQFRDDSRRAGLDVADEQYKHGLALYNAGRVEEALPALQAASRAPKLRFASASLAGRICRDRGMLPQAIELLERAAEAPAPSPAEAHLLLYELADLLESTGETARALAICMELQADAGDYRDVAARVDRLAKVQARG
jgi:tetratricopeptide (TPR) repeat protein